jgi:hypothetical protein
MKKSSSFSFESKNNLNSYDQKDKRLINNYYLHNEIDDLFFLANKIIDKNEFDNSLLYSLLLPDQIKSTLEISAS